MGHNRALAADQDRRQHKTVPTDGTMANGEDAAEQPVQTAPSQATVDHLVAEPDRTQLATG